MSQDLVYTITACILAIIIAIGLVIFMVKQTNKDIMTNKEIKKELELINLYLSKEVKEEKDETIYN